jgi:hypothetical protein
LGCGYSKILFFNLGKFSVPDYRNDAFSIKYMAHYPTLESYPENLLFLLIPRTSKTTADSTKKHHTLQMTLI